MEFRTNRRFNSLPKKSIVKRSQKILKNMTLSSNELYPDKYCSRKTVPNMKANAAIQSHFQYIFTPICPQ